LEQCDSLPSLPAVALKVLNLCKDDRADMRTLARTIEQDPALVARILKVVNSALFGIPRKIGSISQGVNLLGIRKTKIVVLGFSVLRTRGLADSQFDIQRYWARGVSSAISAKLLAGRTRSFSPEEAFVAGLLQDIGVLALWKALPGKYGPILHEYYHQQGPALCELECQTLGADHAAVSAWLLDRWKLPETLIEAVRHHHAGQQAVLDGEAAALRSVLELSDAISSLIWRNEAGRRGAWPNGRSLGLSPEEQEGLIVEVLKQYREVGDAFSLRASPEFSEEELQEAARAELAILALDAEVSGGNSPAAAARGQEPSNELARAFRHWERAARMDALTGLANRAVLDEYLETTLVDGSICREPVGLLMIDVDGFKQVNDSYGHEAGDKTLRAAAGAIRGHVGQRDLAARYGGGQFIVLLIGSNMKAAAETAERIRREIEAMRISDGKSRFAVTVSVGVSATDRFGGTFKYDALLDAADRALVEAKRQGGNRVGG